MLVRALDAYYGIEAAPDHVSADVCWLARHEMVTRVGLRVAEIAARRLLNWAEGRSARAPS